MAYYTIAHYLHGSVENLNGSFSPAGIKPEDMTDEVFDYIFLAKDLKSELGSSISKETLHEYGGRVRILVPMGPACQC